VRRVTLILLALVMSAGSIVVPLAAQAQGQAPARIASGWLPYWMTSPAHPQGVSSAVQNADLFTDVSPFWYSATARNDGGVQVRFNPNFSNATANAAWAMGQLKAAGLMVLPSIADGSGKGRMAATLADPGLRTQHISDLVTLVTTNGYDGIDLDYETFAFTDGSASWPRTQPSWTAFIGELAAALHAQGKLLSVTIPPPCNTAGTCGPQAGYWVYDIAGIGGVADRVRVMAYDYHVNGIGPVAPMPWVRSIVAYSASVMPASRLQIGVPTYGRAWTRTQGSSFKLTGNCPTRSQAPGAYSSLTSRTSVNDADVPALLSSAGVPATDVQWSEGDQENWVYYDKKVTWTDGSGASQTCTAKRVLWFAGPQAVLARTQLVGEFGLSAAAYWTVGGEDPAQWPLLRAYAQSLAPASTEVAVTGVPSAVFGTPVPIAATVTSLGAPVVGVSATIRFRAQGTKKWVDVQTVPTGADGVAVFPVTASGTGDWQVFVPPADARTEGTSSPFTMQILSLVTASPMSTRVPAGGRLVVKGWARPAMPGQALVLQLQKGVHWKNVASLKANAKGRARLVATAPKQKGRYVYRIVAVGKGTILTGASTQFPIRVTR
jgi:spore germination protein YaaH